MLSHRLRRAAAGAGPAPSLAKSVIADVIDDQILPLL